MPADSYKGLTIRIGADTTGLTRALKQAERAARSSQYMLNRMTRALQFDPSSMAAMQSSFTAMSERAMSLSTQLALLKSSMKQIGAMPIEGFKEEQIYTVQQLAEKWDNVLNESTRVRDIYNQLIEKIHELKRSAVKDFEDFQQAVEEAGGESEKLVDEFYKLHKESDEVKAVSEQVGALGMKADEANDKLKALNAAVSFQDAKAQAALFEAEIEKLSADFVEMVKRANLLNGHGFQEIRQQAEMTDAVMDRLEAEINQVEEALKLNPRNITMIARQMNLAEQSTAQYEAKLELARQRLAALEKAGAKTDAISLKGAYEKAVLYEKKLQEANADLRRAEGEASELRTALEKMENAASSFEYQLQKSKDKLGDLAPTVQSGEAELKLMKNEVGRLSAALDKADARVEQLKAHMADTKARHEVAQVTEEYRKETAQVEKLEAKIDSLNSSSFGRMSGNWAYAIRSMGTVFSATITPMAQMAGQKIVEAMDTLDASYRDMRKTVNGTEEDFEHLRDAAIEFSQTHAVTADTILEIEAMGGQLGILVENLEEFGSVASNLDIATNLDAETIAQDMGQLNNIMKWGEGDMTRFGDALVRLGNNMPAQESSIVSITTRIGAMSAIIGMNTQDTLAWSAALASTGQGAEAAGTAFSKTLAQIDTAVAGGEESVQAFADVAQMSASDFISAWNEGDITTVMKNFISGLNDIEKNGGSANATLQGLKITGVRQKQALQGLMNTLGLVDDALVMSNDAWNGVADSWGQAGDAAYEAQQKSEGFSGQLQILKNNATALAIEVAESLAPWLKMLTGIIQKAVTWYKGLNNGTKQLINGLGLLAVAVGPVMTVFGVLAQFLAGPLVKAYDEAIAATMKSIAAKTGEKEANIVLSKSEKQRAVATAISTKATEAASKATKVAAASAASLGVAIGTMLATMAVVEVVKYVKAQIKHKQAIDSLSNAYKVASKYSREASASLESDLGAAIQNVHSEVKTLNKDIEEFADEWDSAARDISNNDAAFELVKQRIDSLVDSEGKLIDSDSPAAIADLSSALERLNELAGTSFYLDEETKEIKEQGEEAAITKEALDELIETKKAQARVNAYANLYTEALEKQAEAQKAVADAQKAYNEAYAKWANEKDPWAKQGMAQNLALLEKDLETAEEAFGATGDAAQYYHDQMSEAAEATDDASVMINTSILGVWPNVRAEFEMTHGSINDFISGLNDIGYTQDELAAMTPEQWASILQAYDGNISSVSDLLDVYVGRVEQASNDADTALSNSAGASAKMSEKGKTVVSKYLQAVSAKSKSGAPSAGRQMVSEMASGADAQTNIKMVAAGAFAAQGLINGVDSKYRDIYNKGGWVANVLNAGLKDRARQGSPWKTTMESGQFAALGLIEGIDSEMKRIEREGRKSAQAALDGIDSVLSEADRQVALDMSASVAATASSLNGIVSGQALATQFALQTNGLGTVNNYSINGIDYADNETIKAAFAVILTEMQRLGRM